MTQDKLYTVLEKHGKWLRNEEGGERANLRGDDLRRDDLSRANLSGADLSGADLSRANLSGADLSGADLRRADLCRANLSGADLSGADLSGANLSGADLSGANIDYSTWPLWCGSLDVKVDRRIFAQLAFHLCRLDCDDADVKGAQKTLHKLASEFHRFKECGEIPQQKED